MVAKNAKVFEVGYYGISDFCRVLEKCSPKNDYVYLSCDGSCLELYAQTTEALVLVSEQVTGAPVFNFGVESSKLVALWKKLYSGSPIRFQVQDTVLTISEDNVSVKFPTVVTVKYRKVPEFPIVVRSEPEVAALSTALASCAASVVSSKQVPGVLLDNTGLNVCRAVKVGNNAFKMDAIEKPSFGPVRVVVSEEFCTVVSMLSKIPAGRRDSISALCFSPLKSGVVLSNGVQCYMPTLQDYIPASYMSDFAVSDSIPQVPWSGRVYRFGKKRLEEVLDLVSAVVGVSEAMVLFSIEGASVNGNAVFRVSAKTHTGCEVSELLESETPGFLDLEPFRVNKASVLLALKAFNDSVFLIDRLNSPLAVFQDESGRNTVFLSKALA